MAKTNDKTSDKTSDKTETAIAAPAASKTPERLRFSIYARDENGKRTGDAIAITDNPHTAYHLRNRGKCVIDHANGDREYDGTNPAASKK